MSQFQQTNASFDGHDDRVARIEDVLVEYLERRYRGENVSDEAIISGHSELMPELGEQLKELGKLPQQPREQNHASAAVSGTSILRIHCPHCHQAVEVSSETPFTDITCSACGSRFSLVGDESAMHDAAGLQRIAHFELIERLGVGAFGNVWKARDTRLDRTVAVKIPRKGQLNSEETEKFLREARAAAQLHHPNIVTVHEVGRHEETVYIVSDLIHGVTLADWLADHHASAREAAELCAGVADALYHAHQNGVIHRDLKPQNILIDPEGKPHLMDFGLARRKAGEITMTIDGQVLGTPAYMSPEQARGEAHQADHRTDVYSLGVVLFELLTGELPFRGNPRMLIHQVLSEDAPSPRRLIYSIPRDVETICLKCLEKDPGKRYRTAKDAADELRRYLNCQPIFARRITQTERAWRWCKRNPVLSALCLAVVATLGMGTVVATWQARQATKQSAKAARNEYVATMNLIQSEWDRGNTARVRTLLEKTNTYVDRGYEWYYWQWKTHRELKTLRGHTEDVYGVAFSPDGQRIVTGSADHSAVVWEAATGRRLTTLRGHGSWVHSVAFSPDGKRILTSSWDHTAKVWDAASGEQLITLEGHNAGIAVAAFSPNGQRIVTGSNDKTVKFWDAATGKEQLTIGDVGGWIWSLDFSPDGNRIVTENPGKKTAIVWDSFSDQKQLVLQGHSDRVIAVAFSPDGQNIVTGSADKTAKVWDAVSGEEVLTLEGHTALVMSVAYSPNGKYIVTGGVDQTARVWDAASARLLRTLRGHDDLIRAVAFSPDSNWVATASRDQTVKVWAVTGDYEPLTLAGHGSGIKSVKFSPDGQRIVTGSADHTAVVWNAATCKRLRTLRRHGAWVGAVAFSPDGQRIVTASWDHTAKIWDVNSGMELHTFQGHDAWVSSAAFSPDGGRIVTGSGDHTAKVWDATSGRRLLNLVGHKDGIFCVAYSPSGQHIVTGSGDRAAKVRDAMSGKILHTLRGHTEPIRSVAYAPNGRRLVTGSDDGTCKVWGATSGRELFALVGHKGPVKSVAFSPDGWRIVTGSDDQTVKVWEASSGGELLTLQGHEESVESVAFSPDGQRIAAGGRDQTVKLWQAASPEQVAEWDRDRKTSGRILAKVKLEQVTAAEHVRAPRRHDTGAIKQWLLLAPITFEFKGFSAETRGAAVALIAEEQLSLEGALRPAAGQRVRLAGRELEWRKLRLEEYVIDFNLLVGDVTHWAVAYAVCYIQSDIEQTGLVMYVGSDDQSKVYLNGEDIYVRTIARSYVADQDAVTDVSLKVGMNVLVFKVMNNVGDWQGSIRFTDHDGNQVKGITVTLDPL